MDLAPAWAWSISPTMDLERGSPSRSFLSLEEVAQTLPSWSQTMSWMSCLCSSQEALSEPFSMSQTCVEITCRAPHAIDAIGILAG